MQRDKTVTVTCSLYGGRIYSLCVDVTVVPVRYVRKYVILCLYYNCAFVIDLLIIKNARCMH